MTSLLLIHFMLDVLGSVICLYFETFIFIKKYFNELLSNYFTVMKTTVQRVGRYLTERSMKKQQNTAVHCKIIKTRTKEVFAPKTHIIII
jgi:hypothetical protein